MTSAVLRRRGPAELAAAALLLALIGPAHGQSKGPPAPAAPAAPSGPSASPPAAPLAPAGARAHPPARPPRLDPDAIAADLARPDTIASALAAIQAAGPDAKKLAPLVEDLLARGLPPDLAPAALAALGAIGEPRSSAAVAPYMSHRVAAVRRAAAEALARTRGPDAAAALLAGLRSTDAEVRRLSARGLRLAGDASAVPDLLRALDRGELDAAPAIAALCAPAACHELVARWEVVEKWDRSAPGAEKDVLDALLARKPPLPDDVLLAAIEEARSAASATTRASFRSAKKDFRLSPRVRRALEAASREPKEPPP